MISRAGTLTGKALANLVNTFNPGQILIGGTFAAAGEPFLTAIQTLSINGRSPPLPDNWKFSTPRRATQQHWSGPPTP